jgi:hypothetical protein
MSSAFARAPVVGLRRLLILGLLVSAADLAVRPARANDATFGGSGADLVPLAEQPDRGHCSAYAAGLVVYVAEFDRGFLPDLVVIAELQKKIRISRAR